MKKLISIDNTRFYAHGSFSDLFEKIVGHRELRLHIVDTNDYGVKLYLRKRDVKKLRDDLTKVLEMWEK